MKLNEGNTAREYSIVRINALEEGMSEFLFTLGCYPGERITIISQLSSNFIVNIKDARYSLDENLASAIFVEDINIEELAV
ncbi:MULTISPECIES: FeoA family protein [unclassified Oceanispirochaeta]|uniref:FeoA family protein n=1 Tax=unclassified Oceanispirochaeta TaxID=2635722 RepID=UPI000E096BFA|nr:MULTISPECIES: FeoA family protein [unclassified Oceanispirochaeta]MBF9017266.1 ferrous iron transport protein A [Oceanispirochaeta sp. M2]NPD75369.1 ferrous iron transport protein A [Oceanispirochaeta sp. M1]RDG28773.1 ferrous iron transport protein A [Oceanispirochaeta sp. M1]